MTQRLIYTQHDLTIAQISNFEATNIQYNAKYVCLMMSHAISWINCSAPETWEVDDLHKHSIRQASG